MENIYYIRKRSGLSQRAFAKLLDISQTTLHLVEKEKMRLPEKAREFLGFIQEFRALPISGNELVKAFHESMKSEMIEEHVSEKRSLENKLFILRFRLQNMKQQFEDASNGLHHVFLEETYSEYQVANGMDKTAKKLFRTYKRTCPERQWDLEKDIKSLEYCLELVNTRLNELGDLPSA